MNFRHTVIDSEEGFDNLESEWNLLSERTDSHVFQTYDWNRTWWKHFGDFGKLQLFVLYHENEVVGIAPLFSETYSLFGLPWFTCLRMIGSRVGRTKDGPLMGTKAYSDYLQFLILDDYVASFYNHFMAFINNEIHFDSMVLEEIPERSSTLAILENDFFSSGYKVHLKKASRTTSVEPVINSWEGYLKKLSEKERKSVRKSLRNIESDKENLLQIIVIDNNHYNFIKYLKKLIELHQDQWNKGGFPGTFSQNVMCNFFLETSEKLRMKGAIRIYAIMPPGNTDIDNAVAMAVVINYHNRMYLQHGAMDMSSPYIMFGPGKTLNSTLIKEAVQSSVTFDFLRGDELYKKRLANSINQNVTIEISPKSIHKDGYILIINALFYLKNKYVNEQARKYIITNNHSFFGGWYHYTKFLVERMTKKANTA